MLLRLTLWYMYSDGGGQLTQSWLLPRPSLAMDDELDRFIGERKERVARDRAGLEQDPPYMEVTVRASTHACTLSFF